MQDGKLSASMVCISCECPVRRHCMTFTLVNIAAVLLAHGFVASSLRWTFGPW